MRQLLRSMAAALAVAACLGAAHAGSVQLIVTDKDDKPVPDVVVVIESASKALAVPAAAPVVIEQRDLRFVPFLTVVPVGSTLRFVNRDDYDHHVRSTPSGPLGNTPAVSSFELRLDAALPAAAGPSDESRLHAAARKGGGPGAATTSADVRVDKAGAIGLGCHLHSSMRGQVYVSASPWFGKTDMNGAIVIDGVPDGAADIRLWHADQLQDQPVMHVTLTGAPLKATAQLNFTPRRRRN